MTKMRKFRSRRHRRQANMKLRSRGKFEIRHNLPGGRTGSLQSKRNGK